MTPSRMPAVITHKTKTTLKWTIIRLPSPIQIYSVKLNTARKCIIVRDAKNKLYKKFLLPELIKYNLPAEEERLVYSQRANFLDIVYTKPQQLIDIEEQLHEEKKRACPDIPNECKAQ